MVSRKKVLAIALAMIMVTAAGCGGFGTDEAADGPAGDQNDSDQGDDLDQGDGETQTDGTNDSSAAGGAADGGDDSGDDTDGATNGDGAGSDVDDDDSGPNGSDGDDGTSDGNGETGDDGNNGDGDDASGGNDSTGDGDDDSDNDSGDEQGTLTITVENESGEPVEKMIIAGVGPDERRHDGRTDENGQATFELPDGDYYWVTDTEGTGYEGDNASVTMDGTDKSITMTVTPATSDLTVTVSDHGGNPLPNATVSIVSDPGTDGGEDVGSTTTNDSGVAEFEVEHGTYAISASHGEYSAAGTAGPIDVSHGGEDVDVTMPDPNDGGDNGDEDENETDDNDTETHSLTVRTPGAPDGTAITVQRETGPDETAADPITKASAGGQASFQVPPGYYHAEAQGYNPTMVPIEVDDDSEITLQEPGPDPIEIIVVDSETGEPIEGAEIDGLCQLWYSSGDAYVTGTTDANGVAQAQADVAPTECDVRVEADGYEPTVVSISVPDDDGRTVEMTPAATTDDGDETTTADESEPVVQAIAP